MEPEQYLDFINKSKKEKVDLLNEKI